MRWIRLLFYPPNFNRLLKLIYDKPDRSKVFVVAGAPLGPAAARAGSFLLSEFCFRGPNPQISPVL